MKKMRLVALLVLVCLQLGTVNCAAIASDSNHDFFQSASPRLEASLDGRRTSVYLYDVTNVADFLAGSKPMLQEVGPFVYDRTRTLQNVTFPQPGVMQYTENDVYMFNEELSYELYTEFSYYKDADDAKRLFINLSAHDIIFGWHDCVLDIFDLGTLPLLVNGTSLCSGYFNRVQQISGVDNQQVVWQSENTITTCEAPRSLRRVAKTDDDNLGEVASGDPLTPNCQCDLAIDQPAWGTEEANILQGGDGTQFIPPLDSTSTQLGVFSPALVRFLPLEIGNSNSSSFTVDLNIPAAVWLNASVEPANSAYYQLNTPQGLLNLTAVSRSKLYVSPARFVRADPSLLEAVDASFLPTPSTDEVQSLWRVEVSSGATVYSRFATQQNFFLKPLYAELSNATLNWFPNIAPLYFPRLWTSEEYQRPVFESE